MTDGRWLLQGTLKGPKGDKGDKGDQGDQGSSVAKDHTREGRVVTQWTSNTAPGQESKQEGTWRFSVPTVGLGSWYLIEMGARMTGACDMTVSLTRNGEIRAQHRLTTDDQPLPVSYTTSRMVFLDKGYYTVTLTTEGLGGKNPLTVDWMGSGWKDVAINFTGTSFGRYFFMYAL